MKRSLIIETQASSCYFRTSVEEPGRKALIQITERCDLRCAHCFVSATSDGRDLALGDLRERILPRLVSANVERVTLTGGEPFVHPEIVPACGAVVDSGIPVGVCTNATQITADQIRELAALQDVHVNVSFDGFRPESHGVFRGDRSSFEVTRRNASRLGEAGLLQGILSTPNALSSPKEFVLLCEFALEVGAAYILMNPLSAFGRGVKSARSLGADQKTMTAIRAATTEFASRGLDVVFIRFPNTDKVLGECEAGRIIYVYADGNVTICPYLDFAAHTPASQYEHDDFRLGNILHDDVSSAIKDFDFRSHYEVGTNATCRACSSSPVCGKGCPAAVVGAGGKIGDLDEAQCPVTAGGRPTLRLVSSARSPLP